jgi:hypothetical protein
VRIAASTEELTLVRGGGDTVLLYLRVTRPTTLTYVLPGTLTASAIAVDLSEVADPPSGYAVARAFALDLARGVAAGPCPAGAWSFSARLEFVGGGAEQRTAAAPCDGSGGAPDVVRPRLRATARSGAVAGGARLEISLSEPARVRVTLERRVAGGYRRVRRAAFDAGAGAGMISIRRAGGRALHGGRYRARVRAVDGAGLQSAKRTVAFTLR